MPRLNDSDRSRILGFLDAGVSQNWISRQFNLAKSTVVRLVRRVKNIRSVSGRQRPVQPRVTSRRQGVFIRQRHLSNRTVRAPSSESLVVGSRGCPGHRHRHLRESNIMLSRPGTTITTSTFIAFINRTMPTAHIAMINTEYLQQQGIHVLEWSSRSPDLRLIVHYLCLIEHLWDELGRRLHSRLRAPKNVRELSIALQEE